MKMMQQLLRYRVPHIWHFTDRANLNSIIEQGGLLSLKQIRHHQIAVPVYGSNEWSQQADQKKGIDDYIHLSFTDEHPMLFIAKQEGRIKNPIWLQIDLSVLETKGTLYTVDIANKSGVDLLSEEQALQQIDFEVLFTYMDWRNPDIRARRRSALKSEILIPERIPLDKIKGIKYG